MTNAYDFIMISYALLFYRRMARLTCQQRRKTAWKKSSEILARNARRVRVSGRRSGSPLQSHRVARIHGVLGQTTGTATGKSARTSSDRNPDTSSFLTLFYLSEMGCRWQACEMLTTYYPILSDCVDQRTVKL